MQPPIDHLLDTRLGVTARIILSASMAFAPGAMVYVVVDEMVSESDRRGREPVATAGLVAAFAVMMLLDNALVS